MYEYLKLIMYKFSHLNSGLLVHTYKVIKFVIIIFLTRIKL